MSRVRQDEEGEEDYDDEGQENDDDEDDEGEAERHSRLLQTVHSAIADRGKPKGKASTVVVGSASNESEFSSTLPGTVSAGGLDPSALLSHVTEPKSALHRLKRKVASLAMATDGISAPLAAPAAQRIARAAAFDDTKKQVDKWQELVKKNREAETLSFPLNAPGQANLSAAALVDGFKPANDMEMEIRETLRQNGATEDAIRAYVARRPPPAPCCAGPASPIEYPGYPGYPARRVPCSRCTLPTLRAREPAGAQL